MARALMAALAAAGHSLHVASSFRSLDLTGDSQRQARLAALGHRLAERFLRGVRRRSIPCPELWFTYHLYHKAPDWLGPAICRSLGIPYLAAEASHAPKQRGGPWHEGYKASEDAIRQAAAVLPVTRRDAEALRLLVPARRLRPLPAFLEDIAPYTEASRGRALHRDALAVQFGLDRDRPWLLAVAMMRAGAKLASYRQLATALEALCERDWQLLVVGDGPARGEVERAFRRHAAHRVVFCGRQPVSALPAFYAAADMLVWPAVNEAICLVLLEAQATGLPVVACDHGGVSEIVRDRETGLVCQPDDPVALAAAVRELMDDAALHRKLRESGPRVVAREHSLDAATRQLQRVIAEVTATERSARAGRGPRDR